MNCVRKFIDLPFKCHLIIGSVVRLILIAYGDYHDKHYDLPYTDVDYKVFTDASRHVLNGESPYKRHTYRYSPLIAYLLVPNVVLTPHFGKIIFCLFDILLAIALKIYVEYQLRMMREQDKVPKVANYSSLFWLYNPLSIAISTRGNADSLPCFIIILSLLLMQTEVNKTPWKFVISGILLGLSIHLRLYPIAYSFAMYLSLGDYKIFRRTTFKEGLAMLVPNVQQVMLASSCISTLIILTDVMFLLYGNEFLFETYLYHLFRKDVRHNFSVLFYHSYLTMDQLAFDIVRIVCLVFECTVLFALSLTFGSDPQTLSFSLFCQSVVLVAYNSVMTSQYFIWFLSLFPLVVHSLKMKARKALSLIFIWGLAQGLWLFFAYLLEFKSQEVFIYIWLMSMAFFFANIYVLNQIIRCYNFDYGFGQFTEFSDDCDKEKVQ